MTAVKQKLRVFVAGIKFRINRSLDLSHLRTRSIRDVVIVGPIFYLLALSNKKTFCIYQYHFTSLSLSLTHALHKILSHRKAHVLTTNVISEGADKSINKQDDRCQTKTSSCIYRSLYRSHPRMRSIRDDVIVVPTFCLLT